MIEYLRKNHDTSWKNVILSQIVYCNIAIFTSFASGADTTIAI